MACVECGGRGIVRRASGLFVFQVQCPVCGPEKEQKSIEDIVNESEPQFNQQQGKTMDSYMQNAANDHEAAMGDVPKVPVPPHGTPVESYLDESFMDKTSPRLKVPPVPMTGPGATAAMPRPFVPVEGAVIPEVVTRQRVIGPKGRDHNAVVSVVVPVVNNWGTHMGESTVSTIEVPNKQAGEISNMLAETIAAMAFENDLMVPEEQQVGGVLGVGQGYPLNPNNPLDGFGTLGEAGVSHQFFEATGTPAPVDILGSLLSRGDFMEGFQLGFNAYSTGDWQPVIDMLTKQIDKLPNPEKKAAVQELFALFLKHKDILLPPKGADKTPGEFPGGVWPGFPSAKPPEPSSPADVFPDDQVPPTPLDPPIGENPAGTGSV